MEKIPNGHKYEQEIFSLLHLLINNNGSIINNNLAEHNALSFTYEFLDYRFFHCLLESNENLDIFTNDTSRKLIYTILKKKDWEFLRLLITKSAPCENQDIFILSLANSLLKEKQIELTKIVISKCTNKDIYFKNGETFVTFIIKANYDESLIMNVIETKLFDINMKNQQNEAPLTLAIVNSMMNLLNLISNLNVYDNHKDKSQNSQLSNSQPKFSNDKKNWNNDQTNQNEVSFISTVIPVKDRIFPEIEDNTIVKYYMDSKTNIVDLYGKVVWSGIDKYGIYHYGLELEKERKDASDGVFEGHRLFECKPNCGILAPINLVGLDNRLQEKVEIVEFIDSKISSTVELSNSNKFFEGINLGIQGNIVTSFFDSLIFGLFYKSDVLDYLIATSIIDSETDEITVKFRKILAFKIIYPLRKYGYVSYDKVQELKNVFKEYGQRYEEFETESNLDNSLMYLAKLWPNEQLLSLISYNNYKSNSMYIQLIGQITEVVNYVTSQNMLDMSMINNEIMFNTLPSCLIMNVSKDNSDINLIPLKTIDISQVSIIYFKKCKICTEIATRQCRKCVEKSHYIMKNGFFCNEHKCNHGVMQDIPFLSLKSMSKCHLFLKSVICYDQQRYIAFVKDDFENRWFRFDNWCTDDRKVAYSSPKITFSEVLTNFFRKSDKQMLKDYDNYSSGSDIRLILRNSNTLIYINPTMTCY